MARQFRTKFWEAVKDNVTELGERYFNPIWELIDSRVGDLEDTKASWVEQTDLLNERGLNRIEQVLGPAFQRLGRITEMGFLIAHSTTSETLAEGEIATFEISNEDERGLFYPSSWVTLAKAGGSDDFALGRVISWVREAGTLDVEIMQVSGFTEPHDAWEIVSGTGVSMYVQSLVEQGELVLADAEAARDVAIGARNTADGHRAAAATSAGAAAASASTSETHKNKAAKWSDEVENTEVETGKFSSKHWSEKSRRWSETAENTEVAPGQYSAKHYSLKAAASAALAALFDPTSYYVKSEVDNSVSNLQTQINARTPIDAQTISSKVTSSANARLVFKDLADNIRALFSLDRITNAWSVITRHPVNGDINKLELSGETAGVLALNGNQIFHAGNVATQAQAQAGTATGAPMDPLRTKQAIAALAGDCSLEIFTASGTFTKQADDIAYYIECIGGGGGGRGGNATNAYQGGYGGQWLDLFLSASQVTEPVAITVGSGGLSNGSAGTLQGQPGGNSSFGSFITAAGGAGGVNGNSSQSVGLGSYFQGGVGAAYTFSVMGGGSGAAASSAGGAGTRGISMRSGNGGAATASNSARASDGEAPGGGGGANHSSNDNLTLAGHGARGEVRVYRFKRIKQ